MALSPEPAMGECLEHRIIRNNLADITRLISSDPSAGPTWLAQKLEEKAFIANATNAVVMGYSNYQQTSKLMEAVKVKISTSQEPGKEFKKLLEILWSNPHLVDLANKLLKQYGKEEHATAVVATQHIPISTTSISTTHTHPPSQLVSNASHTSRPTPQLPYDPSHTPRPPPHLPYNPSHEQHPPPHLPYNPSHEQHPPPHLPYNPSHEQHPPPQLPYTPSHEHPPLYLPYEPSYEQHPPPQLPYNPSHEQHPPLKLPYGPSHMPPPPPQLPYDSSHEQYPPPQLPHNTSHEQHPSPQLPYDPSHIPRPPPQLPYNPSHEQHPPPHVPYGPSPIPRPPPQLPYDLSHERHQPSQLPYNPSHEQHASPQLPSNPSHEQHPPPQLPYGTSRIPRLPPQLPYDSLHEQHLPPQLPYNPSHEQHPPPQLLSSLSHRQHTSSHPSPQAGLYHTPIPHLPTPPTIQHTPTQSPTPPYPILSSYTQPQASSFPAPQPLLTSNPTQPCPSYAYGHTPVQNYGSTPQYTRMPLYSTSTYRPITSSYHPPYMTYDLAHVHHYPPPTQPPDFHTHMPLLQIHHTNKSLKNALTYPRPIPMAHDLPHNPSTPRVPSLPPYVPAPTLHAIDEYAQYLRSHYQSKKLPNSKWPPTASTQYIHLAVVKKKRVSREEADKYTKLTLHGNIDDIVRVKKPLDFSGVGIQDDGSLAQFILVEGAPGIGKSTFAWEVSQRWSRGEILNQYRLVVLLRLRDKRVREARNIYDLFYHSNDDLRREVGKEIERNNGEAVLLLYEGYDELPGKLQTQLQESIFLQILYRECLPKATVLITSRPCATQFLQNNFKKQISQHIEILGFTSADVQSYIQSAVKDQKVQDEFSQYLMCYPHIRGLMYVPLNAVIVTEIYKDAKLDKTQEFVPTTLTELYTSLSRVMLLRYLTSDIEYGKMKWKLSSFSDLPEELHKQFNTICEIAFEGILKNEFIFDDLAGDFNTLDLMQSTPELYVDQGAVLSHNFFHLTLQEFLAAVHVSQQPTEIQLQYFLQSIEQPEQEREYASESPEDLDQLGYTSESSISSTALSTPHNDIIEDFIQAIQPTELPTTAQPECLTLLQPPQGVQKPIVPPTLPRQLPSPGILPPPFEQPLTPDQEFIAKPSTSTSQGLTFPPSQSPLPPIQLTQLQQVLETLRLQGLLPEPQPTTEPSTNTSEPPTTLVPYVSESELLETSTLPGTQEFVPELQLAERTPLPLQQTPQAPQTKPSLYTQDQGRLEPLQVPMTPRPTTESTPPRAEFPVMQHTADIGRLQLETPQLEPVVPQQLLSQREVPTKANPRPVIQHTLPLSLPVGSLPYAVLTSSHFQNVVKFTAGLTKLKSLPIDSILLQDQGDKKEIPLYSLHWLFEAQCISKYSEMIGETTTLIFNPDFNTGVTLTPFDCFVLGFALSHINSTWDINLGELGIGDECLEMMVAGINYKDATLFPSLKSISLDINECHISSAGLSHLEKMPEQIATRITKLDLWGNDDISEGVGSLLSNLTSLKQLDLGESSMSLQEVEQLAELLSHSQLHNLEYLGLGRALNSLESTSLILTALSHMTKLREILLWEAHISENNLSLLTSVLRTNTTIRELDLTKCKINDNMVSEITSALCDNSTLQKLDLGDNAVGLRGATALAEMLRKNETLVELNVSSNFIGEEGTLKLATSLEHNKTLEKLVIHDKYKHCLPQELHLKTKNRITFRF